MSQPGPITLDLLATLDDVRDRTLSRLDGLTDAEYLWEPVPAGLNLRQAADGAFRGDPMPDADPVPAPFLKPGLHALDEVAHHGAELGLLRDLYLHAYSAPQSLR